MIVHVPTPDLKPAPNAFIRFMRRTYRPIGFQKAYNFAFFIIFAGALVGFILDRVPYLLLSKGLKSGVAPGEAFWYSQHVFHIGISLHLSTILPGGMLAVLQFVPIITQKALMFHRINGYLVILLLLLANVGALMIARRAFGGGIAAQSGVGTLAIFTTGAAFMSYYYIKRLQIHLHRAWMLRCWFYAGSIITMRIINAISAPIISRIGSYNTIVPCDEIAFALNSTLAQTYPACIADPIQGLAVVHANMLTPTSAIEAGAAANVGFGMALWMAITIHAIGVDMYLALTPAETERLRKESYRRRLQRGFVDHDVDDTDSSQLVVMKGVDEKTASEESEFAKGVPLAKMRPHEYNMGEISPSDIPVLGRSLRWH